MIEINFKTLLLNLKHLRQIRVKTMNAVKLVQRMQVGPH